MIEEFKNIKSGTKQLREFGLTIGAILLVLGGIALWRGKPAYPYLLGFGAALVALGVMLPQVLKIPQKLWMAFAVVIGFFMTRVILSILFYAVITPIALMMRIFGKDVLDRKINKGASSYWHAREEAVKAKESYLNQY